MKRKGLTTTIQESKGKYTTPLPSSIVNLMGMEKGDKLVWNISGDKIIVEVVKKEQGQLVD